MTALTQPKTLGDLLKYEAPNFYSREAATVASGQNLQLGTVLGKNSTNGKYYAINPAATDGTQTAVGVLGNDTDATLIERDDALIVVRHAIVARNALIWPSGITAPQKAEAEAQLVALGVLVRDVA